ncbi:MAG: hypothetical protein ABIO92_10625 [Chloroflexia bacterium]
MDDNNNARDIPVEDISTGATPTLAADVGDYTSADASIDASPVDSAAADQGRIVTTDVSRTAVQDAGGRSASPAATGATASGVVGTNMGDGVTDSLGGVVAGGMAVRSLMDYDNPTYKEEPPLPPVDVTKLPTPGQSSEGES